MPTQYKRSESESLALAEGFEVRTLVLFFKDRLAQAQLLLPIGPTTDDLVRQRCEIATELARVFDEQADARRAAAEESRRALAYVSAQGKKDAESALSPPGPTRSSVKKPSKFDIEVERVNLQKRYDSDQDAASTEGGHVQIYDCAEPLKLLSDAEVRTPDKEWRERDEALYERLTKKGSFRRIGRAQSELEKLSTDLKILRGHQPHFGVVVDLILGKVRMAQAMGVALRLPPILLAGPPGVGKTHFTLELSRVMQRPLHRHSMDMSHTGSSLMGSARTWGNTQTGLVFNLLCLGDQADPIVLLDELDKARRMGREDSTAPLHSLLEPLTAKKVKDISAGIEFDASHIFWVATANDLSWVPGPIKSRFLLFNIAMPTAEQAIALAQSVGMSVHLRMNQGLVEQATAEGGAPSPIFAAPSPRLLNLLAHLTPREQIQALEHAYAVALANGRRQVLRQDLPAVVLLDDGGPSKTDQNLH